MNAIATLNRPTTMSSHEIAELTGKEHQLVIVEIVEMLDELGDGPHMDYLEETLDARGYITSFSLPEELTFTLASGYSTLMRHRIVTRWLQLEDQARRQNPTPTRWSQALRLAADKAEEAERAASGNLGQAARMWAQEYERNQEVKVEMKFTAEEFDGPSDHYRPTLIEYVRCIKGVNTMKVTAKLAELGYLYREEKCYRVNAEYLNCHFAEKVRKVCGRSVYTLLLEEAGQHLIDKLARSGELPMKRRFAIGTR